MQRVDVKVQNSNGKTSAILGGLQVGQRVVVVGAQSLQNGMAVVATGDDKPTMAASEMKKMPATNEKVPTSNGVQKASVAITEKGYEPASLNLKAGVPARVTFTRKTDATCGTEIVFPRL